jgi:hypothetical protein
LALRKALVIAESDNMEKSSISKNPMWVVIGGLDPVPLSAPYFRQYE